MSAHVDAKQTQAAGKQACKEQLLSNAEPHAAPERLSEPSRASVQTADDLQQAQAAMSAPAGSHVASGNVLKQAVLTGQQHAPVKPHADKALVTNGKDQASAAPGNGKLPQVGERISVYWDDDEAWYSGTVKAFKDGKVKGAHIRLQSASVSYSHEVGILTGAACTAVVLTTCVRHASKLAGQELHVCPALQSAWGHSGIRCFSLAKEHAVVCCLLQPGTLINTQMHAVVYDDGEREQLDLSKETFKLLPPKPKRIVASKARAPAAAVPEGLEDSDVDMSEGQSDAESDDDFDGGKPSGGSSSEDDPSVVDSESDMDALEAEDAALAPKRAAGKRKNGSQAGAAATKNARGKSAADAAAYVAPDTPMDTAEAATPAPRSAATPGAPASGASAGKSQTPRTGQLRGRLTSATPGTFGDAEAPGMLMFNSTMFKRLSSACL